VQHLTWNGHLFWFYDPPMGGSSPFGPFNNRNLFAGYMVTILGPAAALTIAPGTGRWRWLAALCLAVGGVSVLTSLSRGGMLALAVTVVVAVAGCMKLRRGARTRPWRHMLRAVTAGVLVVTLAGAALYMTGQTEPIAERLTTVLTLPDDSSVGGRLTIWSDTLRMIAARPLLGTGLNTFVWGHLPFRSSSTGLPQHAHNEYLEVVAETGILGGAICLWFLWILATTMRRELRRAESGFEVGLRLGAIASWAGILVYALTDFPTVAPATNYVLALLAGLALVPVAALAPVATTSPVVDKEKRPTA
jgi:O-antigen ligase